MNSTRITVGLLSALLVLALILSGATNQVDPTPQTLFYAGFNAGQITTGNYSVSNQGVVFDSGKIGTGMRLSKGLPGSTQGRFVVSSNTFDARRGSIAFWIKLNNSTASGPGEIFAVYPGPPYIGTNFLPNRPDPNNSASTLQGEIDFNVEFDGATDVGHGISDTITTGPFNFIPGDWHHIVWTWQGMHHKLYLDGQPTTDKTMVSPMPPQISPSFIVGISAGGTEDITIDELGTYNFAMTPGEVVAAIASTASTPVTPVGPHALDVTAQWGPGVGKVHVTADPGNDFELQAGFYAIDVVKDNQVIKSAVITNLRRGFGETLVDLGSSFAPGTYKATVTLLSATNTVLATKDTAIFVLPATSWLGNSIGISTQVQPPWTPIQVQGAKLSVWGRVYDLSGGFGLPQQITSQGQPLLSKPVNLDFDAGSGPFNLSAQSLQITSTQPHKVTWTGTAAGGGISATVSGSLEYDGMMLLALSLAPTSAPVTIKSLKLQTALPTARALYYAATGDNPYWWYPRKTTVPTTAGVFMSNTDAYHQKTMLMPSIVFSDNDRGLEWFAENLSGWQVDSSFFSSTPIQQLIRDTNGDVRLENDFATQTFTLSQPLTITFAYEATPIKPLPADWRTSNVGTPPTGGGSIGNDFSVFWSWPDDFLRRNNVWPAFRLSPDDLATYTSRAATIQQNAVKIAPYTDQHVAIASGTDVGSTQFYDILSSENLNDGWVALPTKGTQDYWVYNFKRTMDAGGMDAVYIDEPFVNSTLSASLLSGSGYLRQDGTHGVGYNLLGMRDQLKRIRQVIIDHGKRPIVWIHSTANMQPHAWAFADVISDGESYMFNQPTDPDWIDLWGNASNLPWLLSIGRGEKYGFVTAFLNEIKFWSQAVAYTAAYRAMVGLEQLLDINPIGDYQQDHQNYMQPRVDFGITASDVSFHGYWEQTAIVPDNSLVKASYYSRATSTLGVITNLGEAYSGTVAVSAAGLGLDPASLTAVDAESKQPLTLQAGGLSLSIPRHNYRLVQFTGKPLPLTPASVIASPTKVYSGGAITVTVAGGPGNATDWVGLYAAGSADAARLDWQYLNGSTTAPSAALTSATLTFAAPTAIGNYEFRLFSNDGYTLLATSPGVTVASPPDTTPPSVSVTAPLDAAIVTSTPITVSANASDNVAVAGVQFLFDGANLGTESTARPYSISWDPKTASNGSHILSARARDAAGNTATSSSVRVTVDNQPPSGAVVINNGAVATNSRSVALGLSATDAQGPVTQMRFSNTGVSYSTTQTYATSAAWTVTAGSGKKTVYAQFRDAAGNWSSAATATIVLDTTAPTISRQTTTGITSSSATITWATNEPATSQVNYGLTTSYGQTATVTTLLTSHSVTLNGLTTRTTYNYRVRSKDAAGNEAVSGGNRLTTK